MSSRGPELLFIDAGVLDFPASEPDLEVHRLDDRADGLVQIAAVLQGRRDVGALHVVSHGAEAELHLAGGRVGLEALAARADDLARIGAALRPGGDLLLYGCHVGAGARGAAFVEALAAATGANVAASTGLTGAARLGGDWALAQRAGHVGAAVRSFEGFDGVLAAPTATVSVLSSPLRIGDTSTVTITFSEAVTGFTTADIGAANGFIAGLSSSDGGVTWTATFTPNASIQDASNVLVLDMTGVTNLGGEAGVGTVASNNFQIDTLAPTATISLSDDAVGIGETAVTATIVFSEPVTGLTVSDFSILNTTVSNLQTSDNITYTVLLTPSGAEGARSFSLPAGRVFDAVVNGNAASATVSFDVDFTRPTATVLVNDTDLRAGETTSVSFTFSEAVVGFTTADVTVANGSLSGLSSADGGITWTATFTPADGVVDGSNLVTLNLAGVADEAGNTGLGTVNSINYAVSTVRPMATLSLSDASLSIGETAVLTVTFSEAVTGLTLADFTVGAGALAGLSSSDGGVTWTATFTPAGGVSSPSNVITLTAGGVANAAGNGNLAFASAPYAVQTQAAPPAEPQPPLVLHGTAGDDTIYGDSGDSRSFGGDGDDLLTGGEGADTLDGEAGDDFLHGNVGADSLAGGEGADILRGGQGEDFLHGGLGADLLFGDLGHDTVHGGQGFDVIQGGAGDDVLSGDLGDDVVRGGQGDDVLFGGDGADFLAGDRGSDTLTGGAGADVFHSFGDAGLDLITDFDAAQGDRLQLEAGTAYTLSQSGADTVVSLAGGARVVLAGVQLSSLPEGWIVA